jgi:hypothetical protein
MPGTNLPGFTTGERAWSGMPSRLSQKRWRRADEKCAFGFTHLCNQPGRKTWRTRAQGCWGGGQADRRRLPGMIREQIHARMTCEEEKEAHGRRRGSRDRQHAGRRQRNGRAHGVTMPNAMKTTESRRLPADSHTRVQADVSRSRRPRNCAIRRCCRRCWAVTRRIVCQRLGYAARQRRFSSCWQIRQRCSVKSGRRPQSLHRPAARRRCQQRRTRTVLVSGVPALAGSCSRSAAAGSGVVMIPRRSGCWSARAFGVTRTGTMTISVVGTGLVVFLGRGVDVLDADGDHLLYFDRLPRTAIRIVVEGDEDAGMNSEVVHLLGERGAVLRTAQEGLGDALAGPIV